MQSPPPTIPIPSDRHSGFVAPLLRRHAPWWARVLRLTVLGLLCLVAWHFLTIRTIGPASKLTIRLVQSPSGLWVSPSSLEHPNQSQAGLTASVTVRRHTTPVGITSSIQAEGNSREDPSGSTRGELVYGGLHSYVSPSMNFRNNADAWIECLQNHDAQAATVEGAPLSWSQQLDIVSAFARGRGIIYHGVLFRIFFQWGWAIGIPLWCMAAFISVRHVARLWGASKTFMALRAGRCPNCHYAMAGLDPNANCPECGTDPNEYRRQKLALLAKDKGRLVD